MCLCTLKLQNLPHKLRKFAKEKSLELKIPQLKLILKYLLLRIPYLKNYSFDHIFAASYLSVLVDKTKSTGEGLRTAHTDSGANEESRADNISLKVKLEDLSDILKDTRSAFFIPNTPPDEPIIISDESE
ncbi:hypothetical protein Tco_0882670 [Tanacetum coccineum]